MCAGYCKYCLTLGLKRASGHLSLFGSAAASSWELRFVAYIEKLASKKLELEEHHLLYIQANGNRP